MEIHQNAVKEKVAGALEKFSHSVLVNKYKETSEVVKNLFFKLLQIFQEKAANSETVKHLKEIAKSHLCHLTRRLSRMSPYIYKALENRLAIAYVSLLLGFIAGRFWIKGYPQLQSQQMLSLVCGSYSGPESIALCRIPVPRLTSNYQVRTSINLLDSFSHRVSRPYSETNTNFCALVSQSLKKS